MALQLRQRAPLEGEVKGEYADGGTPREERAIQDRDAGLVHVRHGRVHVESSMSLDDLVSETVRLLEEGDEVDMARGQLLKIRDALSDALDAPAAAHHRPRRHTRRASQFEERIEKVITEAANEAVRAFVRERRPSAVVPAEGNALVQQPSDAEAQRAAEELAAQRARRREGELLSDAIVRQTNKVTAVLIATVFGWLQIADIVTWEDDEERGAFAGNTTSGAM